MKQQENYSNNLIHVSIVGGTFEFDKTGMHKPKNTSPKVMPQNHVQPSQLLKRTKRIRSRLIKAFHSIKNKPSVFITLSIDRIKLPFVNIDDDKKLFIKFVRNIKRLFPQCWFIYKIEWSKHNQIHFHLIGSLSVQNEYLSQKVETKLRNMWNAVIRSNSKYNFDMRPYNNHISYITKASKNPQDMTCNRILGKRKKWGYINKENIVFHKKQNFSLTPEEFDIFTSYIIKWHERNSSSQSHIKQLNKTRGMLSFIPNGIIKKAMLYAKR